MMKKDFPNYLVERPVRASIHPTTPERERLVFYTPKTKKHHDPSLLFTKGRGLMKLFEAYEREREREEEERKRKEREEEELRKLTIRVQLELSECLKILKTLEYEELMKRRYELLRQFEFEKLERLLYLEQRECEYLERVTNIKMDISDSKNVEYFEILNNFESVNIECWEKLFPNFEDLVQRRKFLKNNINIIKSKELLEMFKKVKEKLDSSMIKNDKPKTIEEVESVFEIEKKVYGTPYIRRLKKDETKLFPKGSKHITLD